MDGIPVNTVATAEGGDVEEETFTSRGAVVVNDASSNDGGDDEDDVAADNDDDEEEEVARNHHLGVPIQTPDSAANNCPGSLNSLEAIQCRKETRQPIKRWTSRIAADAVIGISVSEGIGRAANDHDARTAGEFISCNASANDVVEDGGTNRPSVSIPIGLATGRTIPSCSPRRHGKSRHAGGHICHHGSGNGNDVDGEKNQPAVQVSAAQAPRRRRSPLEVMQCDKDTGTLIKVWTDQWTAARALGISPSDINDAAHGRTRYAGGYLWRCGSANDIADGGGANRGGVEDPVNIAHDSGQAVLEPSPGGFGTVRSGVSQYDKETRRRDSSGSACRYGYGRPRGRTTVQCDIETGNPIKTWPSRKAAAEALGIAAPSIANAIHGRKPHAGGFIWRDGGTNDDEEGLNSLVAQVSLTTGRTLKFWSSEQAAAEWLDIPLTSICDAVNGRQPSGGGFIWRRGVSPSEFLEHNGTFKCTIESFGSADCSGNGSSAVAINDDENGGENHPAVAANVTTPTMTTTTTTAMPMNQWPSQAAAQVERGVSLSHNSGTETMVVQCDMETGRRRSSANCSRAVIQCKLGTENPIQTWPSPQAAADALGICAINIFANIYGWKSHAGGFIWRRHAGANNDAGGGANPAVADPVREDCDANEGGERDGETNADAKESGEVSFSSANCSGDGSSRAVIQCEPGTGNPIQTWPSPQTAADALGICAMHISAAIHGWISHAGGFVWRRGSGNDNNGDCEKNQPSVQQASLTTTTTTTTTTTMTVTRQWPSKAAEELARRGPLSHNSASVVVAASPSAANGCHQTLDVFFPRRSSAPSGDDNGSRNGNARAVIQCDAETGNGIKTWPSREAAGDALGISATSISAVIHGKQTHAGGFVWLDGGTNDDAKGGEGEANHLVAQMCLETGRPLKIWPSAHAAAEALGVPEQCICDAVDGLQPSVGGFIWRRCLTESEMHARAGADRNVGKRVGAAGACDNVTSAVGCWTSRSEAPRRLVQRRRSGNDEEAMRRFTEKHANRNLGQADDDLPDALELRNYLDHLIECDVREPQPPPTDDVDPNPGRSGGKKRKRSADGSIACPHGAAMCSHDGDSLPEAVDREGREERRARQEEERRAEVARVREAHEAAVEKRALLSPRNPQRRV